MKHYNLAPGLQLHFFFVLKNTNHTDQQIFTNLIDAFGRAGEIKEMMNVYNQMKVTSRVAVIDLNNRKQDIL